MLFFVRALSVLRRERRQIPVPFNITKVARPFNMIRIRTFKITNTTMLIIQNKIPRHAKHQQQIQTAAIFIVAILPYTHI